MYPIPIRSLASDYDHSYPHSNHGFLVQALQEVLRQLLVSILLRFLLLVILIRLRHLSKLRTSQHGPASRPSRGHPLHEVRTLGGNDNHRLAKHVRNDHRRYRYLLLQPMCTSNWLQMNKVAYLRPSWHGTVNQLTTSIITTTTTTIDARDHHTTLHQSIPNIRSLGNGRRHILCL